MTSTYGDCDRETKGGSREVLGTTRKPGGRNRGGSYIRLVQPGRTLLRNEYFARYCAQPFHLVIAALSSPYYYPPRSPIVYLSMCFAMVSARRRRSPSKCISSIAEYLLIL